MANTEDALIKFGFETKNGLNSLRGGWFLLAIICFSARAFAQGEAALPSDLPPLPSPGDQSEQLYVTKNNVSLFHEVLIAPLAVGIKEGHLAIPVVSKLQFRWQLSAAWDAATLANIGEFGLDEQNNLISLQGRAPTAGLPFGDARLINQESDPVRKAYKILWNLSFAELPEHDILYGVNLYWVGTQSYLRKSTGLFYRRMLPPPTGETSEKPIFRQDVLQLVSPPVVFGFAELSWRFFGLDPDKVWIYSPVIERSREIFEANRGDPILDGALTFDDLFVWSGKVQSMNAKVVADKTLLVPFPLTQTVSLAQEEIEQKPIQRVFPGPDEHGAGLIEQQGETHREKVLSVSGLFGGIESKMATMLWNFESKRFPTYAPWIPTEAKFVPRPVWIIELSPRNPFYLSGRQVLVVDQELMLPVYKVVYNRRGGYDRLVMGGWALAMTEDKKIRLPFSAFTIAVEQGFRPAVAVSHSYVNTFRGEEGTKIGGEVRKLLDIASHGRGVDAEKQSADESGAPVQDGAEESDGDTGASPAD